MALDLNIPYPLMLTRWSSQLNPVIDNPIIKGLQINGITLKANTPKAVNTMLSRMQQGWFPVDITSNAAVWRTQPFNSKTLTLESSADTTVSVWVY